MCDCQGADVSLRPSWRRRIVAPTSAPSFGVAFLVFGVVSYMHVDGVRGTVAWT